MNRDEKATIKMYKGLAEEYHGMRLKKSFYNEMIEMPAMIKMLGNIKGKKILDWGCGSGLYIKKLKSKCAEIKGFDISQDMIKIAREINPTIDIREGSGTKIPFKEEFDIVFASLAIHYLKDLDRPFKEIHRVLKPKGVFIFSTGNIVSKAGKTKEIQGKKYKVLGIKDYFKMNRTDIPFITKTGKKVFVFNYLLKPKQVIQTAQKNGFEVIDYEDAKPISQAKKLDAKEYEYYSKVPIFAIWKLRKR